MPTHDPDSMLKAALGGAFEPFPWQRRLLCAFLDDAAPSSLDLPTGLGKTSVMAIWLVARALAASHLPRRLIYVVDRRAVVDQATRVAEELAAWVADHPSVQDALGTPQLPVSTLRGQFIDNRRWLEDPSTPAIVVGTVDMIGSRLLFEGYGTSRRMRPYHAGFLGTDSLVVLDEAHLVPPFQKLMEQVSSAPFWPEIGVDMPRPIRMISLSATGAATETPFHLDAADHAHPTVQERIHATKALTWHESQTKSSLAELIADAAWELAETGDGPRRVIVFTNKRDDAEKALALIEKKARGERERKGPKPETALLVGGRRLRERTIGAEDLARLGFVAGNARELLVDHAFLFTTSAGEVGVDLDADDAVMDVVEWERMVQRLGRVNRRGHGAARVSVIAHPDAEPLLPKVRALVGLLPRDADGAYDASPAALTTLRDTHSRAVVDASSAEPLRPALSMPLVQSWSMTSLPEHTGRPEVAPWIRGWTEDEAQTTIVWRMWTPPLGHETPYLENAPPHPLEQLEIRTSRVLSWLLARASRTHDGRSRDDETQNIAPATPVAWLLNGAGELVRSFTLGFLASASPADKRTLERTLPGTTLVVDARLGGLSKEGLLDDKEQEAPVTIGSLAWSEGLPHGSGRPIVPWRMRILRAEEGATQAAVPDWFESVRLPWQQAAGSEEVTEWLVVERFRGASSPSEEGRSGGRAQSLTEHSNWTAGEASRIATALGLPKSLRDVLVIAARLHDEGKRAPRWQRAFTARTDGGPWAKTRGPVRPALLGGYRHELGSLPLAERDAEFKALPPDDQALVLHLIAAHHGHARPLIPWQGCDDVPPSKAKARAEAVARRFVALEERWGPWRLAWLESLLRAADQTASRRNDEGGA